MRGRRAASTAAPFTRRLNRFLGEAPATIGLVADLFGDLDRRNFPANLLELFYYGAAMSARFDEHSHILPSRLLDLPSCGLYATTPVAGCEARPGNAATRAPRARRRKRRAARRPAPVTRAPTPRAPSGRPAPEPGRRPTPAPRRRPLPLPLPGDPPEQLPDQLEDLLDYLLK